MDDAERERILDEAFDNVERLNAPDKLAPPVEQHRTAPGTLPLNSSDRMDRWREESRESDRREREARKQLRQHESLQRQITALQAALDKHINSTSEEIESSRAFVLEVMKQALQQYSQDVANDVHELMADMRASFDSIRREIRIVRDNKASRDEPIELPNPIAARRFTQ